jgi:formiminoglutamase
MRTIPPPNTVFYQGRPGDVRLGQRVLSCFPSGDPHVGACIMTGFPDSEGVKQNKGRPGAEGGPDSIRTELYKMTPPAHTEWRKNFLVDWGNCPVATTLDQTHQDAAGLCEMIALAGATGVVFGGGHDFAASTFLGFMRGSPKKSQWGLVNIDPHLDTREMESSTPHSGNAFRHLLDSNALRGQNLIQFGARSNRNTASSWKYCVQKKVQLMPFEKVREKGVLIAFKSALLKLSQNTQKIGVTLDMDACSEAEGVSAPPVIGFTAWELCCFAAAAGKNPKVAYLEIAEVAPSLDPSRRSSRIAAEVVFSFLNARHPLTQQGSRTRKEF